MTRRAQSPAAPTFRTDESTGTRTKERVSAELPRVSPSAFARRLLDAGRARDALDVLDRELLSGRESAELQYWVGRAAFSLGDCARAERALTRAAALSPDEAETHRWLARVLLRRGNVLDAMRILGRSSVPAAPRKPAIEVQVTAVEARETFTDSGSDEPPTVRWPPSRR